MLADKKLRLSYIVILHQTTTHVPWRLTWQGCHISLFYIKPQPTIEKDAVFGVVIYRYSTSNHNYLYTHCGIYRLSYIVILHQTTTKIVITMNPNMLSYIVILHQTTTAIDRILMLISCHISLFYIKPQLFLALNWKLSGCHISLFYIKPQHEIGMYDAQTRCHISLFYIKPQLNLLVMWIDLVVIYRYSTSNHNSKAIVAIIKRVVIYRYSTSNHNFVPWFLP